MLIYPDLDPVAVTLGPLQIHWYGIMYVLAIGFGWGFLLKRRDELSLSAEGVGDLVFAVIIGVILGGRLGYVVFYNPVYYFHHPLEIIALWDGGMSFHGGLIGTALAAAWFARQSHLSILALGDHLSLIAPVGLGLGRLGNFINGELWGRPADPGLPWAMIFPHVDRVPRHPSQLYEALGEGLVLWLMVWLASRRRRRRGQTVGILLSGYGAIRFGLEFFRAPDPHLGLLFAGLSMGQILSLPMVGIGVWLLLGKADIGPEPSSRAS